MSDKPGDIESAVQVSDKKGRQYHINLGPKDVAPYIIIVGDPNRAKKAAKFLTDIRLKRENREFYTFTGMYHDTPITIMSTGIGTDNVEIVMLELLQIIENPTVIRVGSSGGLQKKTNLGDLVISSGAVRLENTSLFFVDEGYPAVAHHEVILALSEACTRLGQRFHIGLTASASGFYGAQGREIPSFPLKYPNLQENLSKRNVYNFEMESSTLFTLGNLRGIRTGTICAIYANRYTNKFIAAAQKDEAEKNCIKSGLEACRIIHEMDQKKNKQQAKHWLPSLSLSS